MSNEMNRNSEFTPPKAENKPKSTSNSATQQEAKPFIVTTAIEREEIQQKTINLLRLNGAGILDQARLRPLLGE